MNYDVQLQIGESRDSGFVLRTPRNDGCSGAVHQGLGNSTHHRHITVKPLPKLA